MRRFTLEDLKRFDGKDGRKAYVACSGLVYDVSESFLWRGGNHQGLHEAGRDLTEFLKEAPHGEDILKRFPVIGYLEESP